ncbi:hypothetical protein ACFYVL_28590 [Streptomyces sp. NPDC004111]|uniref:hypothetical protein n=1 Tax=Streptomyces sp. NPDC004111 TaxID=3364690 RepID=UPI0036CCAE2A
MRDEEDWGPGDGAGRDGHGADAGQAPYPRSPFSVGRARRGVRVTPFGALLVAGGLVLGVGTGWLVNGRGDGAGAGPSAVRIDASHAVGAGAPGTAGAAGAVGTPGSPRPAPVTSPPSSSPSPSSSPTPTVPADFAVVRDPSGVTLAVPGGWRRSEAASVYYRAPDAPYSRFLQFWPLAERDISATRALRITVATHRGLPGFELEALHPTGRGAAELRYSYDSPRTGRRLALLQRVFTAGDGRRYAFAVVGPAEERRWHRATLIAALAPFTPP